MNTKNPHIIPTEVNMSSTGFAPAVLYTFTTESEDGIKIVQVARLTGDIRDDWRDWPDRYIQDHPGLKLQSIAGIRFMDERPRSYTMSTPWDDLRHLPWWKRLLWAVGFWVGLCLMIQAMFLLLYFLPA